MPAKASQFQKAWSALYSQDTTNFNREHGVSPPPSRSSSPTLELELKKSPSQYELASIAIQEKSPESFNKEYGFSGRKRKTRRNRRRNRKLRKSTRRQRR